MAEKRTPEKPTSRFIKPGRAEAPRVSRRVLLTGAGGLAAGVTMSGSASAQEDADRAPPSREPVYRETEHIRQFYARSRF